MVSAVVLLVILGTAVWVYADAKQLGVRKGWAPQRGFLDAGPAEWAAAVALVWIVGFPYYLATRPTYVALSREQSPPTTR